MSRFVTILGKSNWAADTLSHHPTNPDSSSENGSDSEAKIAIYYGLSCSTVQDIINPHLVGTQLPIDIRLETQSINNVIEEHEQEGAPMKHLYLTWSHLPSW